MSNELRYLVKKIQFVHDLTIEQVAKSIGYSRVHLSKEMKKDNKDFVKLLYKEYPDILQNDSQVNGNLTEIEAALEYSKRDPLLTMKGKEWDVLRVLRHEIASVRNEAIN